MPRRWRKELEVLRQRVPDELVEELRAIAGEDRVRRDESLARHTSYRIGGPAELFIVVPEAEALRAVLGRLAKTPVPVTILGGGSNVLVLDGGVRGAVLTLGRGFDYIEQLEVDEADAANLKVERVRAGAATSIGYLVKEAKRRGWAGLAPIAGTPGTIGGALKMNAGDRSVWLGDFVESVRVVLRDGGEREIDRDRIGYGYRTSGFPPGAVIAEGRFRFQLADPDEVRTAIDSHISKRRDTQPLSQPSGGSVFRNPEGASAGELIERVGLKGVRLRQAQISPVHANFIVNLGGARARDVVALIRMVKDKVYQETGIRLEEELRIIGEPGEDEDDEG